MVIMFDIILPSITVVCYFVSVHTAIMCHAVKFLLLIITCIIITDGVLCHEVWKRQSNGTESEPTTSEFTMCVHLS